MRNAATQKRIDAVITYRNDMKRIVGRLAAAVSVLLV
jgi:hypothetical protein